MFCLILQRQVTSQLHQFLVDSQLSGMERLLLAANVTSMKKLLDADEEELGNHGITSAMVHRLTVKLKKYIIKHPEVDNDEDGKNLCEKYRRPLNQLNIVTHKSFRGAILSFEQSNYTFHAGAWRV